MMELLGKPQYYLVRWKGHLANYSDSLYTLREQEELVDCSLACEDGVLGAHRVVLASVSPYLKHLMSQASGANLVIALPNTSCTIALLLVEFMYRGHVQVPQNRLENFLVLARSLKVTGLTQVGQPVEDRDSRSQVDSDARNKLPEAVDTTTAPSTRATNTTSPEKIKENVEHDRGDPELGGSADKGSEGKSARAKFKSVFDAHSSDTGDTSDSQDETTKAIQQHLPKKRRKSASFASMVPLKKSTRDRKKKEPFDMTEILGQKKKKTRKYEFKKKTAESVHGRVSQKNNIGEYADRHGIEATKRNAKHPHPPK